MASISHIHQEAAQRIRSDLLNALGTENVPNQWMHFMATVRQHLPEVLSRGRPTKQAIDASVVGALGFTSWRALLEAPTDAGGLGLTWSTWRQWSRAWAIVQKHPSLENAPLTAAEINRLHSEARASDRAMPGDMAAVEAFEAQQAERKKAAQEKTQAAMRERIEAIEAQLTASREEVARTHGTVTELRRQLDQAHQERTQAEHQLQQAQQERQALENELQAHRSRGFWQRLKDVFSPQ